MDTASSATDLPTDNPAPQQRKHNSVWNFEPVYFEVENEIFTLIKKDLLVPGSTFEDLFEIPPGNQPGRGKDSTDPIVLDGIKARYFHAFCSTIYPWANGRAQLEELDEDTLLGVLYLANMWRFPEIRKQAIDVLSTKFIRSKDSPKKIRLGEKYFVQQWALDGYAALVVKRGLKFGELEKEPYNFDDTVTKKILHLQLNYGPGREHGSDYRGYHCTGYVAGRNEIDRAVKELLSDELAQALHVTDGYTL